MTQPKLSAMVRDEGSGAIWSGDLWIAGQKPPAPAPSTPQPARPLQVGATFNPEESELYGRYPIPAFARVFSPPGKGLPNINGTTIGKLPVGTVPWISHKDHVDDKTLLDYWARLPMLPGDGTYPWTPDHELAPAGGPVRIEYLDYLTRVYDLAREHAPHVEVWQIQTNYAMRWRKDTVWSDWIAPGIPLGFDCYPLDKPGLPFEPPASMFGLLEEAAREFGCPAWGVPELGAAPRTGCNRGDWFHECVEYLDKRGAAYVGLWGSHEIRDGIAYDYRPTDPATADAWTRALLIERNHA